MTTAREEKALHDVFLISIWIKGLVGLGQVAAGGLLLAASRATLTSFVLRWTTPELSEDPHDWLANLLQASTLGWNPGTQSFASVYLIVHGLIKIVLVAGLLRRKMWSYPVSMGVLGAFIAYQLYRYSFTHSIWLLLLTGLDAVVIALIHHEYRVRKTHGFPV
ncbi:DUF2127 domain-containing protein [Thermomonas sp.]|uniref:DUF2127 domain-containing protein n=1 Tax=Thermomonas sp. TaxID=1971895 RepID=UPI002488B683|nr:DUF2127 domain-containing protein [Thermomonas sp.]MDI1253722.1 DUF2127 domain-containing protein [Thermomonas sp.]